MVWLSVGYTIYHIMDIGNVKVTWCTAVKDIRDVRYHGGYHKPVYQVS